jgi:P-type E1-E2 ATPase
VLGGVLSAGYTRVLGPALDARAAGRLAAQVGICDVRAGPLSEGKAAAVRWLAAEGDRVLLAGDGINDAPAPAAAHTGVAMGRAGPTGP